VMYRGLIKEKLYGKVKLYFPDQAQYGTVTPADVAALDDELKVGLLLSCLFPPAYQFRTAHVRGRWSGCRNASP
jgi:hypothetical protein